MQKDRTTLYVLDWQINNALRLKNELKGASSDKAKKIRCEINSLCYNMDKLDPDRTKRLELFSIYMKEHLTADGRRKRLALLAFSLSDLLHFYNPALDDMDFFVKNLAENKQLAQILRKRKSKAR